MPSAPRYDALVVGGGLAGIAVATLLAKRGRRVALVEPRPEWGGWFPDQRLGSVTVSRGPLAVVGHERLGWADAYFEAIGMALPLLVRDGTTFRREPLQVIWGPRRLTLFQNRGDLGEELRREYRVGEPEVAALLADLDAVYDALAIRLDPSPFADTGPSWARLRRVAAARSFAARVGGLAPADYVRARRLADAFAAYLDAWRGALASEGEPLGTWLFRTALAHRGVVSLPTGRAGVCRLLMSRFQTLGGEVLRTPVSAVRISRDPFVETDGRRITARALIVNTRRPPGVPLREESASPVTTFAYSVPSTHVPEAMGTYLLVSDGADTWSLSRRRVEAAGGPPHDVLAVSSRGRVDGQDAGRVADQLGRLLPFAVDHLEYVGAVRDDERPEPVDPKLWEAVSWRPPRHEWVQAARAPVWWLADESARWLGDAREYRAALAVDRVVRLT